VKATSTGKLPDSLPRNNAVAELCSRKFNVAYCRYFYRTNRLSVVFIYNYTGRCVR
jgi:hypothetical protein